MMRDPRTNPAVALPGLATHFLHPNGRGPACNQVCYHATTPEPAEVNCRKCLRGRAWLTAWAATLERINRE